MKTKHLLLIASISFLLLSCKSDPTDPVKADSVTGVVKDVNGNPVAGAFLNFSFKLTSPTSALQKRDEVLVPPSTTIRFEIPGRRRVKLLIENYVHQPIKVLVDDTLNAGTYSNAWNGTNSEGKVVYSDCYFYKLWLDDSLTTGKMLLIADQHLMGNPLAYALTDNVGRFSIPLSRIPVSETFTLRNASGTIIGSAKLDALQELVAFTPTYFGVATVSLTELRDNTIVLSRQR
jgi:hypothetical protein